MANKYLGRDDAPFGASVWSLLDEAMLVAAKGQLAGRRLLPVEGPFGLGLKAVPLHDRELEAGLTASPLLPVLALREEFSLGVRDVAAYEQSGAALDTVPVAEAARACARREDALVFQGAAGVPGLLTVEGANTLDLSPWDEVGQAAADLAQAITLLDRAGFPGPYALALTPERYNRLFRLYPHGNQSELQHVQAMLGTGIGKAMALDKGGVLLALGGHCASLVLGQDMSVGFVGPAGDRLEFSVTESLTLRIQYPQAICVLRG